MFVISYMSTYVCNQFWLTHGKKHSPQISSGLCDENLNHCASQKYFIPEALLASLCKWDQDRLYVKVHLPTKTPFSWKKWRLKTKPRRNVWNGKNAAEKKSDEKTAEKPCSRITSENGYNGKSRNFSFSQLWRLGFICIGRTFVPL
jgi:hypothetical protein